jgi:hypothetical protein
VAVDSTPILPISSAAFSSLGRLRAIDPMDQFGCGDYTESGRYISDLLNDLSEELSGGEPFGIDNDARVENFPHSNGRPAAHQHDASSDLGFVFSSPDDWLG